MKWQGDEYEVMILGSGLGGLITGTYLSKEHHSVLILKESQRHFSYKERGYCFIPFSNFSEKLLKSSLLNKVAKDLGLSLFTPSYDKTREGKTKNPKEETFFQVILPKSRIDLFYQRSRLFMEFRREFPKEVSKIEALYANMEKLPSLILPFQPRSFIKRNWPFNRLYKRTMDQKLAPFLKEFREFMKLQLISWGNLFSDRFPIPLAKYLLLLDGVEEMKSETDLEMIREKIQEKFLQYGGKIVEIEEVGEIERLEKKWRRGFFLSLRGGSKAFQSKIIIFNSPLHRLSTFFCEKVRKLAHQRNRIIPRYVLTPLFLGVYEKVIPVGMKDLLVSLFDLSQPYEGGNFLLISISPKGDLTKAPEGRRAITVESLITPETWNLDSFFEHQKRVMKHLSHLFPFLEDHIEFIDWNWAKDYFSSWFYPHFYYETPFSFDWREGIIPNRISKKIYFVGKENYPYLGIEGEILSGIKVAQNILKKYL